MNFGIVVLVVFICALSYIFTIIQLGLLFFFFGLMKIVDRAFDCKVMIIVYKTI